MCITWSWCCRGLGRADRHLPQVDLLLGWIHSRWKNLAWQRRVLVFFLFLMWCLVTRLAVRILTAAMCRVLVSIVSCPLAVCRRRGIISGQHTPLPMRSIMNCTSNGLT